MCRGYAADMDDQKTVTCDRCGAVYASWTATCPTCQVKLVTDRRAPRRFNWFSWVLIDLLLPWIGPLVTLLAATRRNDVVELAGVLVWPGVFFAVGAYRISLSEGKMARRGIERERVRRYGSLARLSLLLLVVLEAAVTVHTLSERP